MSGLVDTATLPASGLPGEAYTDAAWFAREQAAIFRPRWLYACHLSQLAETGAFVRWDRDGDSLLIVRDGDGAVRALHNVCRHRGTRIERRARGVCRAAFVCRYHGWAYGLDGALRGAPRMPDDFDPRGLGLIEAPLEVWNGMVFVTLAAQRPRPLAEQLGGVALGAYDLARTKVVADREHVVAANGKVCWENGLECYHCAINHPELREVVQVIRDGPQPSHVEAGEFDFRPSFPVLPHATSVTLDGSLRSRRLLGDEQAPPEQVAFLQWHTTLVELIAAPDHAHLMVYRPIDPGRTAVRLIALVHADAREGVDYDVEQLFELHRVTRGQDDELCEQVQEGLASSAYRPGPFNRDYEFMLQNFVRVYRDALGADHERGRDGHHAH